MEVSDPAKLVPTFVDLDPSEPFLFSSFLMVFQKLNILDRIIMIKSVRIHAFVLIS